MRPAAPVADLDLCFFPVDAVARDADGDGFMDRREYTGATDPHDPQSTGPDRTHSDVDSDGDQVPDLDETAYGTNPNNADTDGDFIADGDDIANGTNPFMPPAQAPARPITTPMI
jgi:hypothetical protein